VSIKTSLNLTPEAIEQEYRNSHTSAFEDLAKQQIYISDDPKRYKPSQYEGQVPEDLDTLTNDELAHLMVVHQSWTSYLNGCYSSSNAAKKVAEHILKGIKSSITAERGKEGLGSDPRFIRADATLVYHTIKVDLTADVLKSASNAYKLMSRLISLREQDMNQTTRRHVLSSSRSDRGR